MVLRSLYDIVGLPAVLGDQPARWRDQNESRAGPFPPLHFQPDSTMSSQMTEIPESVRGWWRIVETSQWVDDGLDDLGPPLISFTWQGAWEFDQMSGSGTARVGEDGRLRGMITIKDGDDSTFTAERTDEPDEPIPDPPSYRDKWRRRRW